MSNIYVLMQHVMHDQNLTFLPLKLLVISRKKLHSVQKEIMLLPCD